MRSLTRVLLTAIALIAIAATAETHNSKFAFGLIQRACAPWDGAAIGLTITTEVAACGKATAPYLMVNVYDLPLSSGKTVKLKYTGDTHSGQASICPRENACEPVESGEVVFDTYKEGTGATGHYELHSRKGETVSGTFDVKWCEYRMFCG